MTNIVSSNLDRGRELFYKAYNHRNLKANTLEKIDEFYKNDKKLVDQDVVNKKLKSIANEMVAVSSNSDKRKADVADILSYLKNKYEKTPVDKRNSGTEYKKLTEIKKMAADKISQAILDKEISKENCGDLQFLFLRFRAGDDTFKQFKTENKSVRDAATPRPVKVPPGTTLVTEEGKDSEKPVVKTEPKPVIQSTNKNLPNEEIAQSDASQKTDSTENTNLPPSATLPEEVVQLEKPSDSAKITNEITTKDIKADDVKSEDTVQDGKVNKEKTAFRKFLDKIKVPFIKIGELFKKIFNLFSSTKKNEA